MPKIIQLFNYFLLAILLNACTNPQIVIPKKDDKPVGINLPLKLESFSLIQNGDIFKGIKTFESAIKYGLQNENNNAYLALSEVLYDNEYFQLSERYFNKTSVALLSDENKNNYAILKAANLLINDSPQEAIKIVNSTVDSRNEKYNVRKLKIIIQAYNEINRPIEEVQARIELNLFIQDANKKTNNDELIWNILSTLPLHDLLIEQDTSLSEYQSWIEFTLLTRLQNTSNNNFEYAVQDWIEKNLQHSSLSYISKIDQLLIAQERPPQNIAIILPVSGKYKSISNSILMGFLQAYYEHLSFHPDQTSEITFYDSGKASSTIWPIYNKAKLNGSDIIIGPLQKHFVDQLLTSSSLPIPVITLNYSNIERENSNQFDLIEFGLRPEDEANQIAQHISDNKLLNSIALVPRSNFGQRMLTTFKTKIEHSGGQVLNYKSYSRKQKDFSRTIKQLIGIDQSQNRYRRLRLITGEKFEFEPRIRQDIDNIFLVADNKQAKLIAPQFKFYQAGNLPIYANSQIYKFDSKKNADLNNIQFLTAPWLFNSGNKNTKNKFLKFKALGKDSFNILSILSKIKRNPAVVYQGEVGEVSLDNIGKLHRKLQWATIKRGEIVKLDF